jgi:hypothetical protein
MEHLRKVRQNYVYDTSVSAFIIPLRDPDDDQIAAIVKFLKGKVKRL